MIGKISKHIVSIMIIVTLVIGLIPKEALAQGSLLQEKIEQGYIPIASKLELKQIETSQENTFGVGTEYEKMYIGGLDKKYILVSDIDLSGDNFVPIGYDEGTDTAEAFVGTFEGNNFIISNLNIDREKELQGLFSKLGEGAVIEGITIDGANLKTDSRTGALAGESDGAIIQNSKVNQVYFDFNDAPKERNYFGGFIGKAGTTDFAEVTTSGLYMTNENPKGPYNDVRRIGGIVGSLDGGSIRSANSDIIKIQGAAEDVLSTGMYFVINLVGGIAGDVQNSTNKELIIDDCSVTNLDIKFGFSDTMLGQGGLIGAIGGMDIGSKEIKSDIFISNSSATGQMQSIGELGMKGATRCGGFVGYAGRSSSTKINVFFENCTSTVDIKNIQSDISYADTAASNGTGGFASNLVSVKAVNCNSNGILEGIVLSGAGGFVGWSKDSYLEGCSASGNIFGYANNAGFALSVDNSEIRKCFASGNVKKSSGNPMYLAQSGGFVFGMYGNAIITDCYYTGDIGDEDSYSIAGFAYSIFSNNCTVTNVYTSGIVKGTESSIVYMGSDKPTGAYYNITANPTLSVMPSENIKGISFEEMKKKATFENWSISNKNELISTIWEIDEDVTTPYFAPKKQPVVQTPPTASAVTVSGTAKVGEALTGSYAYSDEESDLEGVSTFKWYRATDNSGTGKTEIAGANAKAYTLQAADLGKYISFEVTPVAATGTKAGTEVLSSYTSAVVAASSGGSGGSGGSGSGGGTTTPTTPTAPKTSESGVIVIVNGEKQIAGTEYVTEQQGIKQVEVKVDTKVINQKIDAIINQSAVAGRENIVEVPILTSGANRILTSLTGDSIKKMYENDFNLSLVSQNISYTIPAKEINIDELAKTLKMDKSELQNIEIQISMDKVTDAVFKDIASNAEKSNYKLVLKPVEFTITAKKVSGEGSSKSVTISKFNQYVQREFEIPEGIDPTKITTGIVYNEDGTFSHIPTTVFVRDGKYYARLNSLTNSKYSVIWNPIEVKSVEKHWAKDPVNDMASRLVVKDIESFEPNKAITRGDFAEYITKALGIYRTDSAKAKPFSDIELNNSLVDAIAIASEYGIINGYPDGTFRPNETITREEAMSMYAKAMEITQLDSIDKARISKYKDRGSVSKWAYSAVQSTIGSGVFNGRTVDKIEPKGIFTYAEAATAIRNLLVKTELINK